MSVTFARRNNTTQQLLNRAELLSSRALPQQKIIVITDKVGFEPNASSVIASLLKEQYGDTAGSAELVAHLNERAKFQLMIISNLERRFEAAQIFKYITRCRKTPQIQHVFVWIVEQKLKEAFLLPYIEHMADSVITFEEKTHLSLLVKKHTGAVTNKYYEFDPMKESFFVVEVKRSASTKQSTALKEADEPPAPNPAALGTFKIDLKDEEMAAKNALTLPFEFFKTLPEGGKILYHPDAEDDLDEEDPDDDLLI
ncbi:elongator complex protein 5 [Anopheles maculipalpis]|uniref:elongator complex protein 5 n=1 Tax=Anopheles maculipalpis TaxID=1496333 RepID=UPI002158DF27|nr:elongator complex protein 5 [Anopheles maculipalpis]XP_050075392.1 elongator complex protein 5 [Anopheles maculipalpis]XP_050075393.1 elongator complex protein 5 [Anopheles maculipalpis]